MSQIPPLNDEKQFEKLIRDSCRKIYNDHSFELYGKRGERQHGVDGYSFTGSKIIAFQCKKKDVQNTKEDKLLADLKTEMREETLKAHHFFKEKYLIKNFIFATTFKNTKHLQDLANELSLELGFQIEYWGWDTISEYIQKYPELIKTYYPQFIFQDTNIIEKCVWHITNTMIEDNVILNNDIILEKAIDYYKINDNENLVFQIICNKIDVPNTNIIQDAKKIINNIERKSAFWITGNGGTGKTSLLLRLAVEYALDNGTVFFINFENHHLSHNSIPEILSYIKTSTDKQKAYIFIDNPAYDQNILEIFLKDIVAYQFNFIIVFTERAIRLDLLKRENIQYAINAQTPIEPLKLVHSKSYRERVYRKFFELIDPDNQNIWNIIQEIGVNSNLAFVNATYRILYELNQKRYIDYVFDWVEFENMARQHFPSLFQGFKYIALFYLFEIKTPLSLLIKILKPPKYEIEQFKDSFSQTIREPLIVIKHERTLFNPTYFYRTKHEIISELYFEEKGIDKNQLLADAIHVFDEKDSTEVQTLINLFGNRPLTARRLCQRYVSRSHYV